MKVSEINLLNLKEYLRVDHSEEDTLIQNILTASKSYIKSYTGLTEAEIESKEDLTIALLALCSEMYENRQYTFEKTNMNLVINPIIKSILDMHSVNFL